MASVGGRFGGLSAGGTTAQGPQLYTFNNDELPEFPLGTFGLYVYDPYPVTMPASITIAQAGPVTVTPEPGGLALLSTGLLGAYGLRRRLRLG